MRLAFLALLVPLVASAQFDDIWTTNAPGTRANVAASSGFAFGSLALTSSNSLAMSAGQFTQVTNYAVAAANAFTASAAAGTLTNRAAGYYRVSFDASWYSGGTDLYRGSVFTNGVECTLVSFELTATTATNNAAACAVLYLPTSCRIDARLANLTSGNAAVLRKAHLVIGTP